MRTNELSKLRGKDLGHITRWFSRERDELLPTTKDVIIQRILKTKHRQNQTAFDFLLDKNSMSQKLKTLMSK